MTGGLPLTGCPVNVDSTHATLYDVNCTGKQAFNAPRWTGNAAIQHSIPTGRNEFVLSVRPQYRNVGYTNFDYDDDAQPLVQRHKQTLQVCLC